MILLIFAVVIIDPQADRGLMSRPGGAGRLAGVAAFRVALEVESLRKADVNVFGTTDGVSRIASVDDGHGPVEVSVVGCPAKFDAALRRTEDHRIVGRVR